MKAVVDAVKARVESLWSDPAGLHPEVPVFWQNEPNNNLPSTEFIMVEVIGESEGIVGYGGGRGRNEWAEKGRIETSVLVPINTGVDIAWTLADDFATIFRGWRSGGITCYGASRRGGDRSADDGSYWVVFVIVDFEYRFVG